jgi:hypothetical protein
MEVLATFEADLKIHGLVIPFVFSVVEKLSYDCILGMNFLQETNAVIDATTGTLGLYHGLLTVPMIRADNPATVQLVCNVTLPPLSETALPIKATQPLLKGTYVVENETRPPHNSLLVGRTLVNVDRSHFHCRVLNPTDKAIRLKKGTIVGELTAAAVIEPQRPPVAQQSQQLPSVAQMRAALEEKGISFKNTVVTGADLDNLITLLYKNIDLMATSIHDLPGSDVLLYHIDTGDHPPVSSRAYRHSPNDKKEISLQTKQLLEAGLIEPSDTPWLASVVLVTKKDGSRRFCCDWRALNSITLMTSSNLPSFMDLYDVIAEAHSSAPDSNHLLFTALDLRSGYQQVLLDPATAHKTGFRTHEGTFIWKRLSFGLCNAVQFFQRVLTKVLASMPQSSVLIYIDDILVLARSPDQMIQRLQQVFDCFRAARLRLHPAKCQFSVTRVLFLGHVFDNNGLSLHKEKISVIQNYPRPTTVRRLKSFYAMTSFYKRFIKDFSHITTPFRALLKQDAKFQWTDECEKTFQYLKAALTSPPILALPDFNRPFLLTTDASKSAISFILSQKDNEGRERVIEYSGQSLNKNQLNWTVSEKEAFAVVQGVRHYHTYLSLRPFQIISDHITLTYLNKMRLSGNSRLARWALALQPYTFDLCYTKGSRNVVADAVSRLENMPVVPEETQPTYPKELTKRQNNEPHVRLSNSILRIVFRHRQSPLRRSMKRHALRHPHSLT